MRRYQGAECPVCNKTFVKDDDIVVCPVCGAPHHRECYKDNAGCALESQHAIGKEWQPTDNNNTQANPGQNSGQAVMQCGNCGGLNPPGGIFCQLCGSQLNSAHPGGYNQQGGGAPFAPPFAVFASPYGGLNPEEEIDGITIKELATYVGPASYHYVPRFKLLAENKRAGSFNWSAFFFTFFYFFYRKINKAAVAACIIFALTLAPSFYYAYEFSKEVIMQYGSISLPLPALSTPALEQILTVVKIMQGVQFGLALASGFLANRLYLQSAAGKIKQIRSGAGQTDTRGYINQLAHAGGVSPFAAIIAVACLIMGYFAVSYMLGTMLLA